MPSARGRAELRAGAAVVAIPVGQVANVKLVDMVAMRNVEIEQSNNVAATEWQRYLRDMRNQEAARAPGFTTCAFGSTSKRAAIRSLESSCMHGGGRSL